MAKSPRALSITGESGSFNDYPSYKYGQSILFSNLELLLKLRISSSYSGSMMLVFWNIIVDSLCIMR